MRSLEIGKMVCRHAPAHITTIGALPRRVGL